MDALFHKAGTDWLRWTDSNGNTWEAEFEAVKFLGKECFEQMLEESSFEIQCCGWEVTFKQDDEMSELPEPTEEDYEYVDSWYNL